MNTKDLQVRILKYLAVAPSLTASEIHTKLLREYSGSWGKGIVARMKREGFLYYSDWKLDANGHWAPCYSVKEKGNEKDVPKPDPIDKKIHNFKRTLRRREERNKGFDDVFRQWAQMA